MRKVLISDLDGTIYRNKTVTTKDLCQLNRFTKKHCLVIATGRNYFTFNDFIERFELNYQFKILLNGALVMNKEQEILFSRKFDTIEFLKALNTSFPIVNSRNANYTFSSGLKSFYHESFHAVTKSFSETNNIPVNVNGICIEVKSELEKDTFVTELKKIKSLFDGVNYEFNGLFIDFFPESVSKATAIDLLFPGTKKGVFVIGDGLNDICMAKEISNSFAISSGEEELLNIASKKVEDISEAIEVILK